MVYRLHTTRLTALPLCKRKDYTIKSARYKDINLVFITNKDIMSLETDITMGSIG